MPITIEVTRSGERVGILLLYGVTVNRPDTTCEIHDGGENKHYEFTPHLEALNEIGKFRLRPQYQTTSLSEPSTDWIGRVEGSKTLPITGVTTIS